jgi:hypothetical protein
MGTGKLSGKAARTEIAELHSNLLGFFKSYNGNLWSRD